MKIPEDVRGFECKHVVRVNSNQNYKDEMLVVKENVHMKDGTIKPNLRLIKNFERNFWVTKKEWRNHREIKTAEEIKRLSKFTCTEREMPYRVARALNRPIGNKLNMRMLSESPYLYGSDISSATILKRMYQTRFPDCTSTSSMAVLDIETDVVHGTDQILSVGISFKDQAFLAVNTFFLEGSGVNKRKIKNAFEEYLEKEIKERNLKLTVEFLDTPGQCVQWALGELHKLKPDFVNVFNLDFDVPKMVKALEDEGIDPAQVFSDPSIPDEFKYFYYKKDTDFMITASGKRQTKRPHQRWHTVNTPSSFYWVCSMATYAFIRKAKGFLPKYSLDYILNLELGIRKMKFSFADKYEGLPWHLFMQQNYKVEYLMYNLFDCIGCELLDEKTKDLSTTLAELCGSSEYKTFSSTPSQLADDLHFYFLTKRNKVISSKSSMNSEFDDLTISMDGHIITLPTHTVEDNGLCLYDEIQELRTLLRKDVGDADIKSAYPWGQIVMNVSRETKRHEVCWIDGVDETSRRIIGLNLTGGRTNAVEYCQRVHKTPSLHKLLEIRETS